MADDRTIDQRAFEVVAERPVSAVAENVHYPDSDGHFLPDNPLQANAVVNLRVALKRHFERVANVVVEGDMFLYYEKGNPRKSIAPDMYVVLNHDLGGRPVYKLWEEGKPPDFALEVISPSSAIRNEVEKRALYERLGIGEYFLFQPDPTCRGPRLVGHRLRGGSYEEMVAESGGELRSEALGVTLRVEGSNLRLRNMATGMDYPWVEEFSGLFSAKDEALRRARQETQAKDEALRRVEARVAELEALHRQTEHSETEGQ